MVKNYYSRSTVPMVGNNINGEFKLPVIFLFVFLTTAATCVANVCGLGALTVLAPTVVFMTLFAGAINRRTTEVIVPLYALLAMIGAGVAAMEPIVLIAMSAIICALAAELCVLYRPFLWKNGSISLVLSAVILFLFLSVTNKPYTVTLVVSLLIKSAVTSILCIGTVPIARKLLHNGRVLKWVLKQD